jgi:hypothetical protein
MTWVPSEALILWASLAVLWVGLASVVGLRSCRTAQRRICCCWLFYGTLLALGAITVLAAGSGTDLWVPSGTGLSLMTLGATLDFGGAGGRDPAF